MAETFIKVEGLNRLINRFGGLSKRLFSEKLMGDISTFIITSILLRTARGEDADGTGFIPYSPKYRLFREETGHQGSPVNLFYSGSMLSAMTFKATRKRAEIFFQNTSGIDEVTNPEKAYYNQQKRNFFAVSESEQEQIREMVQTYLREHGV